LDERIGDTLVPLHVGGCV